jgi:hypothetical protein
VIARASWPNAEQFLLTQRRSYPLAAKTDKITYENITGENHCGVRRRIAAKIESDGGNLSEPDRSPPLRSRVEARPTRKKVLSTSSNHLNQKQKRNKWYLVVETPTTPCDAFFFPDRISVNVS